MIDTILGTYLLDSWSMHVFSMFTFFLGGSGLHFFPPRGGLLLCLGLGYWHDMTVEISSPLRADSARRMRGMCWWGSGGHSEAIDISMLGHFIATGVDANIRFKVRAILTPFSPWYIPLSLSLAFACYGMGSRQGGWRGVPWRSIGDRGRYALLEGVGYWRSTDF